MEGEMRGRGSEQWRSKGGHSERSAPGTTSPPHCLGCETFFPAPFFLGVGNIFNAGAATSSSKSSRYATGNEDK